MKATFLSNKIVKSLAIFGLTLGFSQAAQADRVRHCDYTFTSKVTVKNDLGELVESTTLLISGDAAGKHGGVQANTARERARNRIKSCINTWSDLSQNRQSSDLTECTNANISGVPGFDTETDGKSLREILSLEFASFCERAGSDLVLLEMDDSALFVRGDDRCGSTQNFAPQYLLAGELCASL